MKLFNFNTNRLISYALFAFSGTLLFVSFMLTTNIKVLENWKVFVPASQIHAGDTVTLISEYTKLRDVTGVSQRYIECQNTNGTYIRYELNKAIANRAAGQGGTGIVATVPATIPNLPTTCKFTIAIAYEVYPWKKVYHSQSTGEFMLMPPRDKPREVSSVEPLRQINLGQIVVARKGL